MSERPVGDALLWAENATFVGGAYAGEPTKVAPADGDRANGHYPGTRPPAEELNYVENDIALRLRHYDLLELNFPEVTPLLDVSPGVLIGETTWAPFHSNKKVIHVNGENIFETVNGGYNWTAGATTAGATYNSVTCNPVTGTVVAVLTTAAVAGNYSAIGSSDATWGNVLLTSGGNANNADVVEFDPYLGVFWIGGIFSGGGAPAIYRLTDAAGAAGTQSNRHPSAPPFVDGIEFIACSPTYKLAASTPAGNCQLYRWLDADANAVAVAGPADSDLIVDLVYIAATGMFMLVTFDGAITSFWHSGTGAAGSWTNTLNLGSTQFAVRSIEVWGSIVVGACVVSAAVYLAVSTAGGAAGSWRFLPDPLARYNNGSGQLHVRRVGNRLAVYAYEGGNDVAFSFGLRVGPVV